MSKRTILIEGHNLTLEAGTGIATYARVLARTLRELDFDLEVLIGTKRSVDDRDAVLSEVSLHDAVANLPRPWPQRLALTVRQLTGTPFGLKPTTVKRSGAVVNSAAARFATFSRVHAVRDLQDVSRFHFKRYGMPSRLRLASTPALFHATHPLPVWVPGCPNIYTIHDLVPLRLPHTTLDDKKFFLNTVREIARRADRIVTVSEASRADIVDMLGVSPDRVTNTYQSVHIPEVMLKRTEDDVARDLETFFDLGMREYFLFVGAIEPKKNIARLVDAYASSGSRYPLVIVGAPAWQYETDVRKMSDERFLSYRVADGVITPHRRVQQLAYLPFPRLIALMRGARAVLFPSLYEGFGLPVLEAMLAGAPVLTSNVASLPEIAGGAALLINPYDVDDMASGIRALDQDEALRADLVAKGRERARYFSPERYKERLAQLYRGLLS